ncbi:ricin-type beta-trefoil lectin domain protein [Streptomyces toyocaensis]|uniref:ricin-type beta-trefoil lectin domain protein n=1 Tax=Streptomyces toyocaensis TaxID=55952 RepID=UPI000B122066|nr:ricin-type beta-trefoil lectin domain protein [Streptomyces toyocaensis]
MSEKDQRAARAFWTTERLKSAKELPAPSVRSGDVRVQSDGNQGPAVRIPPVELPVTANGTSASGLSALASSPTRWTGGGLVGTTAGKVFFTRANGSAYACSASAVNSVNKSTLLTAGHCIVDGRTGEVYRNWVFIPGYDEGARPFGTFTAAQLLHDADYVSSGGNLNYDYGFVVVSRDNTRSLTDIVGGQGLAFNTAAPGVRVHSFGYGASDAEGNGQWMNHCEGDTREDVGRADSTMLGIDCVQTGGSSGGPFLSDFDPAKGTGYTVGAISASAAGIEYYAPLRDSAYAIYRQAEVLDGGNVGEIVHSSGRCMDVRNSSTANGAVVQLWGCNGTGAQQWYVGSDGAIRALGACLEVPDGATADGTLVQLWECDGGANQRFTVTDAGEIVVRATNKCLQNANEDNRIKMTSCTEAVGQHWKVSGHASEEWESGELVDSRGDCVDVPSSSPANGSKVQLWGCNGTGAQQWYVGSQGTIQALGACLEVPDGTTADGTLVQLWECDGGANQRFTITDAGEIVARATGRCLEAAEPDGGWGSHVKIAPCNGSGNQKWTIKYGTR